ncbi:MAG: hypothetical protein M3R17_12265 [Bacteroidota bacterium]|nr:hypothetical protein [Bacteroidota bacterium]
MSIYPVYPTLMGTGHDTAATGINEFHKTTAEHIHLADVSPFFITDPESPLSAHSFDSRAEKVCRTFSAFGGSWDYSEVD